MSRIERFLIKIKLLCCSFDGVIKYYKKNGMKIGKHCEINKTVNIITEPYLITLGNYVRITSGVKFITHDGGLYVPRHMEEIKRKYSDNRECRQVWGNNYWR